MGDHLISMAPSEVADPALAAKIGLARLYYRQCSISHCEWSCARRGLPLGARCQLGGTRRALERCTPRSYAAQIRRVRMVAVLCDPWGVAGAARLQGQPCSSHAV